ncbi:MFS transporter [Bailinhaonella thermotolerans]|uniref:MFS transporter n=2 Tax=Bailinhaonella thermotolerans TaxID=1070861 RepID=A0A3A4AG02_9ACTN|nr:MFS transporter [Bailinhaonella thermotolerans]
MAVGTVMPEVSVDLKALDLYAWSFSTFLMAGLFMNVVAGQWSDRHGPRVPFLLGVIVFGAGMVLGGLAPGKELFIAARAIQGFGGGAVIVTIYVMIARAYPDALRPRVFAALSAAWVLPSIIGPTIAGVVADLASWRAVFLAIVPLVVPGVIMLIPVLRSAGAEDRTAPAGRWAWGRTFAATAVMVGAGLLLFGVERLHTGPALAVPAALAGLVLLGAGLPRLLPAGALRFARGLPTTIVMRAVLAAAFFGVNAFIPLMLHDVRGFTVAQAGIALTTGALGWSLGSYLQSRRSYDRVTLVRAATVLVAAGVLLSILAVVPAITGWVSVPAWIVAGLGMGLGVASVNVLMMQQSAPEEQGRNSAALQVADTLGSALAVGFGGAITNGIGHGNLPLGIAVTFALMAAIALAGTGLSARMRTR